MGELVFVLQHFCFEEEIDEVAEWEQPCSSSKHNDPSRLS